MTSRLALAALLVAALLVSAEGHQHKPPSHAPHLNRFPHNHGKPGTGHRRRMLVTTVITQAVAATQGPHAAKSAARRPPEP